MIIIVCGLPGTGKTAVAKALAERLGATLIRTDVIRKEMLQNITHSSEERLLVYELMFQAAQHRLQSGLNVVLDGTFFSKNLRNEAANIARKYKTGFKIVECVCGEELVKKRLSLRKNDASDASFPVYKAEKKTFEPVVGKHITIDTMKDTKECVDIILKEMGKK